MTMILRKSRWWKEPMVWLIIALPLTAVIASLITVVIASRNADTLVQGDYQKEGLSLHQHTERDLRAEQLGVSAHIQRQDGNLRVELRGRLEPAPQRILVLLAHPTQAAKDVVIPLGQLEGSVYTGKAPDLRGVNWQVQLEPGDQSWRLAGRWDSTSGDALVLGTPRAELPTHP